MAVVDKFVNDDIEAGKKADPSVGYFSNVIGGVYKGELESGNSNNTILRFVTFPAEVIIKNISISCDALGTSGALNLGLYKPGAGGAVKDADVFLASFDASSAVKEGNGMATLDIANHNKKLYELAGDTLASKESSYTIGAIITNVGSNGAGTIVLKIEALQG